MPLGGRGSARRHFSCPDAGRVAHVSAWFAMLHSFVVKPRLQPRLPIFYASMWRWTMPQRRPWTGGRFPLPQAPPRQPSPLPRTRTSWLLSALTRCRRQRSPTPATRVAGADAAAPPWIAWPASGLSCFPQQKRALWTHAGTRMVGFSRAVLDRWKPLFAHICNVAVTLPLYNVVHTAGRLHGMVLTRCTPTAELHATLRPLPFPRHQRRDVVARRPMDRLRVRHVREHLCHSDAPLERLGVSRGSCKKSGNGFCVD